PWTSLYNTSSGAGGIEDLLVTGSARYVQLYATQSAGTGYSLNEMAVFAPGIGGGNTSAPAIGPDIVWVEDAVPAGATAAAEGGDSWTWANNNPAPYSGSLAHQSTLVTGFHQHFFYGA